MPRRPPALLALLLLLAALGLAACGDDDDSGSGGSADATQEESSPPADDTGTETEAQADLTDTSVKPVIDKPTGVPPRRLVKEDIVKGKGPGAKPGDTVIVDYVGVSFSSGQEFDASWDTGQPFPVQLGAGNVIEGWEKGLVGIKKGGRRKLTIPPEHAYGAQGAPPAIGRPAQADDPTRARLRGAGSAARNRAERDARVRHRRSRYPMRAGSARPKR